MSGQAGIDVRLVGPDDWPLWRELRLAALAGSPEAFRADYAHWSGPGDQEANWRARLADRPFNAIVMLDGAPVAMASATAVDHAGVVELHSMWAAPSARGRGVGDAAVGSVRAWAIEQGASAVVLSVKAGNKSATRLYRRHGFVDDGVPPGHPDEREMRLTLRD